MTNDMIYVHIYIYIHSLAYLLIFTHKKFDVIKIVKDAKHNARDSKITGK